MTVYGLSFLGGENGGKIEERDNNKMVWVSTVGAPTTAWGTPFTFVWRSHEKQYRSARYVACPRGPNDETALDIFHGGRGNDIFPSHMYNLILGKTNSYNRLILKPKFVYFSRLTAPWKCETKIIFRILLKFKQEHSNWQGCLHHGSIRKAPLMCLKEKAVAI